MTNLPDFDTTASVTGATLISQTDEEIRQLMSDVKSYQENVSYLLNNYTSEQIASGLASLESDVQDKINELLSVNPDGTYYTKTAIDNKINDLDNELSSEIIDNLNALAPFNGYFKKPDFIFEENVNNILKYKIQGDYFKVNDKVINTEDITIDMSSNNDRTGFLGQGDNSFVPHVEVQDQTTNGLIVQGAVKKGDYVIVDKEELVDDYSYAVYGEWVDNGDGSISTSGLSSNQYIIQQVASVDGTDYVTSFDLSIVSGAIEYRNFSNSTIIAVLTESGRYTFTQSGITNGYFRVRGQTGFSGTISNISVQLADDTYRAIQDVPALTDLTNTNYFETRDYISNQVASVLLEDGSIHNEVLVNDVFAKDRYKALELNGWSKLQNGLYSKGSMIGTGLGVWQC